MVDCTALIGQASSTHLPLPTTHHPPTDPPTTAADIRKRLGCAFVMQIKDWAGRWLVGRRVQVFAAGETAGVRLRPTVDAVRTDSDWPLQLSREIIIPVDRRGDKPWIGNWI